MHFSTSSSSSKLVRTFLTNAITSVRKLSTTGYLLTEEVIEGFGKHHKRATRIYLWGNCRTGALGIDKFLVPNSGKYPVLVQRKPYNFHWPIRNLISAKFIAAGYGFTVYGGSRKGNHVYVFGSGINTDSQLGYHSQQGKPVDYVIAPQVIELPISNESSEKIRSIACGRAHTVIVSNKAGNNAFGQCGRPIIANENYKASRTVHVIDRDDITKAVCGHDHTILLTDQGKVLSCGLGTDGQTGLEEFKCQERFEEVGGELSGVTVTDISCRCDTVLALSDEGELFGWGNSEYGQFDMLTQEPQLSTPLHLPVSKITGKLKSVAAAGTKCAVVNDNGEVFVWGYGILGQGPNTQQSGTPQRLPAPLFGATEYAPDVSVNKIFCGVNYFAALNNQGNLYTWGKNTHGCLGLGEDEDQFFPFMVSVGAQVVDVSCGADHMVTLCKAHV